MTERIDLDQFNEITKGTWEVIELPSGGIDIGVLIYGGHKPVVNFTQRMGEQVKQIERDVADMNAIASVPELIAELRRCYELIDELENPSHEDERYPEPDELTPSNSSRAGADWPSGPSM
ncbi:MAG: hypothetical protein CMB45_05140 [Euryarchaeota archaeon]|nr:hypothetical protein [Euryarchaeota archaeon]|tara:strand:- start:6430 stop:6789 length:360 start_codon:yes stop_codon:yes gene_type:complete